MENNDTSGRKESDVYCLLNITELFGKEILGWEIVS